MILSDSAIREELTKGSLVIKPNPLDKAIQPASVDLHLESNWLGHSLDPGEFFLSSTLEWIEIPHYLAARVEGVSSLARNGLLVHATAGFIDPGFRGNITLELKNISSDIISLLPGMRISQICFLKVEGNVLRPYGSEGLGSKYQDSKGTVAPKED